ncbi:hypothetical protein CI109_106251 [Kwoniella shandongensis]|uniref:Uncharacterized protein n=1 Tax=Kwoniella shandongensis TaxID=1734106 RepID=A0A5M6C1Q6_9TREE|nr:uncharacterized protein CI109_003854 [Kwoniella shandongensis]KAA5527882.1 hypothetical protein CI109_003854 [Kwoniella shandongensis]
MPFSSDSLEDVISLDPISAVHPQILDILRSIASTTLLPVSQALYDNLIPSLYAKIALNTNNVHGILSGLTTEQGIVSRRKYDALGFVRRVTIDDVGGLERFTSISNQLISVREDVTPDPSPSIRAPPAHEPVRANTSFRSRSRPLFPNVTTLYLPWSLIRTLDDQVKNVELDDEDDSHDDQFAVGVINGLESNSSVSLDDRQGRSYPNALYKLIAFGRALAQNVSCETIELELGPMEESRDYWGLDRTIHILLSGFAHHRNGFRTTSSVENGHSMISLVTPKLHLVVHLPAVATKAYIPHSLTLPTSIHFVPDPQAAPMKGITTFTECGKNKVTAKECAEIIRRHYDVHISRNVYPEILYHVLDVQAVRDELEEMRRLRTTVVDGRLLANEVEGGILRDVDELE